MDSYTKATPSWARQYALLFLRIVVTLVPALMLLAASWALSAFGAAFAVTLAGWAFRLLGTDATGLRGFLRFVIMAPLGVPLLLIGHLLGYFWPPCYLILWLAYWLLGLSQPMYMG